LEAIADNNNDKTISDDLACFFLHIEDVDPDFFVEIWSILQMTTNPTCPKIFNNAALKEPVQHHGKWIAAFYQHPNSCYALVIYGCPKLSPADATVLTSIIVLVVVLKYVLNQLKQAAAHKICICFVNGGPQI
jgi:hypothetical protein